MENTPEIKKPYDFILPNLAVGSFESRLDPNFLAVVTIISPSEMRYISQSFPITTPAKHLMMIPIHDGEMGMTPYFDNAFQFIETHIENGKVLVHCHAGISRSVSMVIYYLSKKMNMHPIDASKIVRKKRVIADPYSGFMSEIITRYVAEKMEKAKQPEPTEGMVILTEK